MWLTNVLLNSRAHRGMHAHGKDIFEESRLIRRRNAHQIHHAAKILEEEDLATQAEHAATVFNKVHPAAPRSGAWKLLVHCSSHCLWLLQKINDRAVFVHAAPLRIKAHQIDVVRNSAPGALNDAAQDIGDGDDRWPHVEGESLLREHIHLST